MQTQNESSSLSDKVCALDNPETEDQEKTSVGLLPTNNVTERKLSPKQKVLVCEKVCRNTSRRLRKCTGDKSYLCTQCGKIFKHRSSLQRHANIHIKGKMSNSHMEEKIYKCQQCEKTFNSSSSLQKHTKTHRKEKSNKLCQYCGKTFKDNWKLVTHTKTHSKEKEYNCSLCEKSYKHSCSLQRHMYIHGVPGEYTCRECGKTFKHLSNFKKHTKSHEKGEIRYSSVVSSVEKHSKKPGTFESMQTYIWIEKYMNVSNVKKHSDTPRVFIAMQTYM